MDVALDGVRIDAPNLRDFRMPVKAGRHVLTATIFDQRRLDGRERHLFRIQGAGWRSTASRSRAVQCHGARATRKAGAGSSPVVRNPARGSADCARRIIVDIASRAFRAPQQLGDLADHPAVLRAWSCRGGLRSRHPAGAVAHPDRPAVPVPLRRRARKHCARRASYAISDIELASRLSFFLWSSIPDQELIDLAVRQKLHRPEVLAAQVKRMLADRRAYALVENFAGQWLYLRELADRHAGSRRIRREPARRPSSKKRARS